jgi:hypothetical protein
MYGSILKHQLLELIPPERTVRVGFGRRNNLRRIYGRARKGLEKFSTRFGAKRPAGKSSLQFRIYRDVHGI